MKKLTAEQLAAARDEFLSQNQADESISSVEVSHGVLRVTLTMKRFLEQRRPSEHYLALLEESPPHRRRKKDVTGEEEPKSFVRARPIYRPLQLPAGVPVEFAIIGDKTCYFLTASLDHFYQHRVYERKGKESDADKFKRIAEARRGLAESLAYSLKEWLADRQLAADVLLIRKVVHENVHKPGVFVECTPEVMEELSKLMGIESHERGVLPKESSKDDE